MATRNLIKIISWAKTTLLAKGYVINELPKTIQVTPWSSVNRFSTTKGYIYLKETPPTLSLEPIIIQFLYEKIKKGIPIVIDINKNLNCFLMQDSGQSLRDFLKKNFQPELLQQAIKRYTNIQQITKKHLDTLMKLGVPDWQLEKMPALYSQLIANEKLLKTDGITDNELNLLYNLLPKFSSWCDHLAGYKIPVTLDHCDFHDNNVMFEVNTGNLTIIDWGETVVTHPFFSLITFLKTAARHHSLKETEKIYIELQKVCFEGWQTILSEDDLTAATVLTKKLWPIYSALGFYRLMTNSEMAEFKSLRGRLSGYFREYIKMANATT